MSDVGDPLRFSGELGGEPKKLLAEVHRLGLEGIIGKLRDSVYEPGRRSGAWLKIKSVNEQEFVIGGYTPPQGARQYFGAILVGYYANDSEGRASARPRTRGSASLRFAGKVGTGFDTKMLAMLYKKFKKEERDDCPFADLPSKQERAMGARDYSRDDAKDALAQSRPCRTDQVWRMDARPKITAAGFPRLARG